jgi:hypothetical protein
MAHNGENDRGGGATRGMFDLQRQAGDRQRVVSTIAGREF